MVNYLLTSTFIHLGILLSLCITPEVNIPAGAAKIEVNIVEKSKSKEMDQRPLILPTSRKPLIPGPGAGTKEKHEEVDLTEYANQVKIVVDPVWMRKLHDSGLINSGFLSTEVLLFPDLYGRIVSMKVVKSSGNKSFDNLALDALREVGQIPKPPNSLIKEGIIWGFSVGKRS